MSIVSFAASDIRGDLTAARGEDSAQVPDRTIDELLALEIADDGGGFDPADRGEGFGLVGMQERAGLVGGTMRVESSDAGTPSTARSRRRST
jgi:glucose-6-phosphate-specific signal transduction histidine kinase